MSTMHGGDFKNDDVGRLPLWRIGIFGLGNFASNLSWTMISSYLALFYTDVVGISASAVATMLLVTRIWDAANDPIMGHVAERTRSKWGRFRPYILFGPPFLVVCTLLTFRNPGFTARGNFIYACITYTLLGMVYTAINVPYNALSMVLSRNRNDVPRIGAAGAIGMFIGMILLMNLTMPLISLFGDGDVFKGYQTTAGVYVLVGMILFWVVFAGTKEAISFTKKSNVSHLESFKILFKSRNIVCYILQSVLFMIGNMGRMGIQVYYYLHVVKRPDLMGIFMSMQLIIAFLVVPFGPALARKIGFKKSAVVGWAFPVVGVALVYFADVTNIPFLFET